MLGDFAIRLTPIHSVQNEGYWIADQYASLSFNQAKNSAYCLNESFKLCQAMKLTLLKYQKFLLLDKL